MKPYVSIIAIISASFFNAQQVLAAATDSDRLARAAFEDGVAAFEEGRIAEALTSFARAYGLRPSYKILFNIAQAEAELGRTDKAIRAFEQYLRDGGADISLGRREKVEAELVRLRGHGSEAGTPGPAAQGADVALDSRIEPPAGHGFLFDVAPWISAGLAATTLTIGIALGAKTVSANRALNETCVEGRCPGEHREDVERLKGRAVAADVMLVATSVFTAAAVSLFVLRSRRDREAP